MERSLLKNRIWYLLIAVGALLLAAFFGSRKQGYYIDEYYTYTLSNGTQLGIAIDEGSWQDTGPYLEQLVSSGEENFRFGQVYENNANDVHPPLYYFLIHLVSSFFPGVFSKWIGIGVNLFLWCFCLLIAYYMSLELCGAGGRGGLGISNAAAKSREREKLSLVAFAAYAFSPAVISGLMLIRMYVQLQLFVMLFALILIKDIKRDEISVRGFLLPVFLTGFFGFLTQYYFVIAMFFMTFFYCILLFLRYGKNGFRRILAFGLTALFSLMATVIPWRVSIFHIFKGYRGADSVSSLMSTTNISSRAALFIGNLNRNVFGGLLPMYCIMLTIGAVMLIKRGKKAVDIIQKNPRGAGMLLLILSSICYFLVIAKIGLKAADASNRYEYPVYGIFIILAVAGDYEVSRRIPLIAAHALRSAFMVILLACILGYTQDQVLYLYPQEQILDDLMEENPDAQIAVFQRDDGKYDTRIKDYIKRDKVYWGSSKPDGKKAEAYSGILSEGPLFVYIDKRDDTGALGTPVFTTPGDEFNIYFIP